MIQVSDDGLTAVLADSLVEAIEVHNMPREFAATYNGVSPDTFERWLMMGSTGTGTELHVSLARRVYKAEGMKVGETMTGLKAMALEDSRAAEAYLKMFKPGHFGGVKPAPNEFASAERAARKRINLLDNPPPRMLAEMTAKGWLKFSLDLSDEDRATLSAIQDKYRPTTLMLPEKAP
jgi:hypothetical protein